MTPKDKAEELVEKLIPHMPNEHYAEKAKVLALILVDEIIESTKEIFLLNHFWREVKSELKNL